MMTPESMPELPQFLGVLPLRDRVFFPMSISGLSISEEGPIRLVDDAMRTHRMLAAVAVRETGAERPGPDDLYRVGCAVFIPQLHRHPDGSVRFVAQGLARIRLDSLTQREPYLVAQVSRAEAAESPGAETEALVRAVKEVLRHVVEASPDVPDELISAAEGVADPRALGYVIAGTVPFTQEARQELLEAESARALLRRLLELLQHELSVRQMQQRIAKETAEHLGKAQREHVLREQLRTIQRELGQEEPGAAEVRALRERAEKAPLSPEARKEIDRELGRLDQMPEGLPERGMVLGWLDWIVSLPWGKLTGGPIDLGLARRILDEDHFDLQKVKDRLLDHLAVQKLRQDRGASAPTSRNVSQDGPLRMAEDGRREPILCFVGPPGVGKTSLGQSIARAMGRRFVRLSLGGLHDEAEIRGHRRTYIGAMPGRILQSMRRADALDPVMMLDEVDKLGAGFQGDPAAALLEVLDPAQNHAFNDTYLGVAFDLSHVLFICTANAVETIPPPLLDRMEVLALSGYAEVDKLEIARRYLLPAQLRACGLVEGELSVDDAAIVRIIREYTREAGVRGLERGLAAVARKAARRIGDGSATAVHVDAAAIPELLGRPRFHDELAERIDRPGVATGLAWTPAGGDILFVEAALMPGKERLILTGMLGDVMRESAQAALTYLRSNAARLGLDPSRFEGRTVHVHVPAGAIPKDGPSAGVAIVAALASAASGRPVRNDVAMTGEITLRGKVLPVGGVREKALAAYRAGVKEVVLPRRNEGDLEDVPAEVRASLRAVPVDSAEDVLEAVLGPATRLERAAPPQPASAPSTH